MRLVLFTVLFLSAFLRVTAQKECVSYEYVENLKKVDSKAAQNILSSEAFLQTRSASLYNNTSRNASIQVYKIPVIVHILVNSSTQSVSDDQVKSQITALNRDFRRDNADSTSTPSQFRTIAADAGIEFVLATADPNGAPTTGIIRKSTSIGEWSSDDNIKFSSKGGDDAWDSKSYLNIWIGNVHNVAGYASVPGGPTDKDGIVLSPNACGTMNVSASYSKGRTAVHEIGHWLGLKHIWGDTYCGDDGIDDTPKQGNFTSGCPSGFRSSCSNGSLGDMYMNYMDYTNDACMNLFTYGQTTRMRSAFTSGGPRVSLLSSKGLNAPWSTTPYVSTSTSSAPKATTPAPEPPAVIINIYPNPSSNVLNIDFKGDETWVGKEVRVVAMNGLVMKTAIITSKIAKVDIHTLTPGMYLLQMVNGDTKVRQSFIKL